MSDSLLVLRDLGIKHRHTHARAHVHTRTHTQNTQQTVILNMCFEDFMSFQFGNKLIRQIHLKAHVQSMILQICKEEVK